MSAKANRATQAGAQHSSKRGAYLHLYLNSFLNEKTETHMRANGLTITQLLRKALSFYLNREDNYWNLVFKNLEHNSMEMRVMHGELLRLSNFFIHFVYYWFMLWPDTDPDQRKDMIERAYVMAERFSKSFKRRLSSGGYVVDFSMEDIKSLILESAPELDAQELHEMLEEERQKAGKDDGDSYPRHKET